MTIYNAADNLIIKYSLKKLILSVEIIRFLIKLASISFIKKAVRKAVHTVIKRVVATASSCQTRPGYLSII